MSHSEVTKRRGPQITAARWLLADPRDVAYIEGARSERRANVPSVSAGLARWQRSIGRRRAAALLRRTLIVGVAAACVLQLAALASGTRGPGWWLAPAVVIALLALAPSLTRRTTPAIAARMLDRDLLTGAGIATAYELERAPQGGRAGGLGSLALADGRDVLARSLGGARARLRPRHRESGLLLLLAAALAGLLLVPALDTGAGTPAPTPGGTASHRLALGGSGNETKANAGPDLRGYAQPQAPSSLTGIGAGTTHRSTVDASKNLYGGGTGTTKHGPKGSVKPSSRTIGNAGYLQTQKTNSSSSSQSAGEGTNTKSTLTTHQSAAAGKIGGAGEGKNGLNALQPGLPTKGAGANPTPATPGKTDSRSATRGGGGTAGQGNSQQSGSRQGTPGGATAGGTHGASSTAASGVVPQLGGQKNLPIQPGYEAVKGKTGNKDQGQSTAANGAGGASHSTRAAGSAAAGGGAGVAYVPPAGASIAPSERRLLIGYFGSYARVAAAGW